MPAPEVVPLRKTPHVSSSKRTNSLAQEAAPSTVSFVSERQDETSKTRKQAICRDGATTPRSVTGGVRSNRPLTPLNPRAGGGHFCSHCKPLVPYTGRCAAKPFSIAAFGPPSRARWGRWLLSLHLALLPTLFLSPLSPCFGVTRPFVSFAAVAYPCRHCSLWPIFKHCGACTAAYASIRLDRLTSCGVTLTNARRNGARASGYTFTSMTYLSILRGPFDVSFLSIPHPAPLAVLH